MVIHATIPISEFWSNTMAENVMLSKIADNRLNREDAIVRNIEFTLYKTTYAGMNGEKVFKAIKKPQDLYRLPIDDTKKSFDGVFRKDLAEAAKQGKYTLE